MKLVTEAYETQLARWPKSGKHILAQYDADSIVVYQAYKPSIADWAVAHQRLGGPELSMSRMSWVKPNFLWMMYRSGWGQKPSQESTLAIRITRAGFDRLLSLAVASSFHPDRHPTREAWQEALARSEVRLQWDPDHDPAGRPCERRALQLGLRGTIWRQFVEEWTLEIERLDDFVREQRGQLDRLITPREEIYEP